jgi:prephenate dehydrogenase
METVAIVGVGLIGASFGLALRQTGFSGPILGVSSPAAIEAGLASGAISQEATLEQVAGLADLIYLAQPVDRILTTLEELGSLAAHECLVTDAGSTKRAIVQKAEQFLAPGQFLGGHPMAGKEQRGATAADGTIFSDRPYVVTPSDALSPKMEEFLNLLGSLGARTVSMSAEEHDTAVAFTSHLPQLLSTAISVTLSEQANPRIREVFGPGLLDMTRLAMSSPDIWHSILSTNSENVLSALMQFKDSLNLVISRVEDHVNLDAVFSAGREFASELREKVT